MTIATAHRPLAYVLFEHYVKVGHPEPSAERRANCEALARNGLASSYHLLAWPMTENWMNSGAPYEPGDPEYMQKLHPDAHLVCDLIVHQDDREFVDGKLTLAEIQAEFSDKDSASEILATGWFEGRTHYHLTAMPDGTYHSVTRTVVGVHSVPSSEEQRVQHWWAWDEQEVYSFRFFDHVPFYDREDIVNAQRGWMSVYAPEKLQLGHLSRDRFIGSLGEPQMRRLVGMNLTEYGYAGIVHRAAWYESPEVEGKAGKLHMLVCAKPSDANDSSEFAVAPVCRLSVTPYEMLQQPFNGWSAIGVLTLDVEHHSNRDDQDVVAETVMRRFDLTVPSGFNYAFVQSLDTYMVTLEAKHLYAHPTCPWGTKPPTSLTCPESQQHTVLSLPTKARTRSNAELVQRTLRELVASLGHSQHVTLVGDESVVQLLALLKDAPESSQSQGADSLVLAEESSTPSSPAAEENSNDLEAE